MLESKLWHNKTETKIVKAVKMLEFIKTYHHYPRKFNFAYFFSSMILPPFCWGKNFRKYSSGEMGNFLLPEGMSKNEKIQFFCSQLYRPVILTP